MATNISKVEKSRMIKKKSQSELHVLYCLCNNESCCLSGFLGIRERQFCESCTEKNKIFRCMSRGGEYHGCD